MKRFVLALGIGGVTAIAEEIIEEMSPRAIIRSLLVAGPGITEREFFTLSETDLFLAEGISFKGANEKKGGVYFVYLSMGRIISIRSAKGSDTEVMCPITALRSFRKGDVIITKMKPS